MLQSSSKTLCMISGVRPSDTQSIMIGEIYCLHLFHMCLIHAVVKLCSVIVMQCAVHEMHDFRA